MDELNNVLLTNSNSNGNSSSTGRLTGLAMNGFPVARLEDVINWYINTQSHVLINSNASSLWPRVMFCLLVINSCQIATEAQLNQDHYTLTKPLHNEFKQKLQAFLSNTSPTQLIKRTLSGCLEQTASSSGSLRQLLKLHKEKLRSCHDPYLQQSLESAERERAADWRNLRYRSSQCTHCMAPILHAKQLTPSHTGTSKQSNSPKVADITFEEPKFDDKTLAKLFSLYFEERGSALIAVTSTLHIEPTARDLTNLNKLKPNYDLQLDLLEQQPYHAALIALAWSFIRFGLCFKIGSSTLKTQLCSPNIKTDLVVACLAQSYFSWFLASVTAITLNPLISISVMETLQKLHRNMEHEAFVGSLLAYACLARNILALKINLFPSAQPPLLERLLMAQLNRKPSSFTGVKDLSRQSMLPLVTQ
ncbi:hypothetical protein PSTG_01667 [Puccinia striiformis f. sp. tritici PST-78]|uniref:Uncharacterized protein n=1 Tax=Puccinia striiformis f. sp. tritici PST-78 TaxID=1165861 RepID=A0A0L0W0J6_9BASI|nr:hypothetical protein PSTG_01667 [Puccinia striiformis f. sp. tritici PST-78]